MKMHPVAFLVTCENALSLNSRVEESDAELKSQVARREAPGSRLQTPLSTWLTSGLGCSSTMPSLHTPFLSLLFVAKLAGGDGDI